MTPFDHFRAYEPEDFPQITQSLINDPRFREVLTHLTSHLFHGTMTTDEICSLLASCRNVEQLDTALIVPLFKALAARTTKGISIYNIANLPDNALLITNHRDIVLDAANLCVLMIDHLTSRTHDKKRMYMGLGTNLYVESWVEPIVRLCRCFGIERGGSVREVMRNSQQLSAYIHLLIADQHNSVWIAQREGRAKDSNDLTQPALLKMLAMSAGGKVEALTDLHITPIAISYEYDPCDYLKAREMQLRRDDPNFHKTPADDYLSMFTGLTGNKGQIIYRVTPCIDSNISSLSPSLTRTEQFDAVAHIIDHHIHSSYHIFNTYRIAYDMLSDVPTFTHLYSTEEKMAFDVYIENQISKIDLPKKDIPFLRHSILTMYANPLRNYLASTN